MTALTTLKKNSVFERGSSRSFEEATGSAFMDEEIWGEDFYISWRAVWEESREEPSRVAPVLSS